MRSTLLLLCTLMAAMNAATASVFLPYNAVGAKGKTVVGPLAELQSDLARKVRRVPIASSAAMAIPGYGLTEQVFVGGFANFLSIYNLVITARILLSWVPQAQGVGFLQPIFQITDPYLNLFRGVIPPIFGLDLSPIAAFFLLNVLTNATAAVGAEIPPHLQQKKKRGLFGKSSTAPFMLEYKYEANPSMRT